MFQVRCLMLMLGAAAQGWDEAKAIISQKHAAGRLAADECRFRKSSKEVRVNQLLILLILKSKPMRFGLCTWQIMANQFLMTAMATGRGHNYQLMDFAQRRISNFEVAHDQAMGKRNSNDWRARDSR